MIWLSGADELETLGVELRNVAGQHVAFAIVIGLPAFFRGAERQHLERHVLGAEIVRQIQFGRGAGLGAHRLAAKLQGGVDPGIPAQQKALAVIIGDAGKHQAERTFPRHRPGRVARQHIDLARLQRRKARGRIERHERHFGGVAEDRRRHGAADIDVKAAPGVLVVHAGKAQQSLADAAIERAALLDGLQRLRAGGMAPADNSASSATAAKMMGRFLKTGIRVSLSVAASAFSGRNIRRLSQPERLPMHAAPDGLHNIA